MAEIDSLEITIAASSTDAADKVSHLAQALESLKTAGSGISGIAKGIETIARATSGLSAAGDQLKNFGEGLKSLTGIEKINIPSTLAKRMDAIKNAASGISGTGKEFESYINSVSSLSKLQGINIPKSIPDRLKAIADAARDVTPQSISNLDAMTASLQRLSGVNLGGVSSALRASQKLTNTETPEQPIDAGAGGTVRSESVNAAISKEAEDARKAADEGRKAVDSAKSSFMAEIKAANTSIRTLKELAKGALSPFANAVKSTGSLILQQFTKPIRSAIATFNKWKNAIGRVAFYRLIRSAIKEVTDGFKTGIENLYQYSTLVGTQLAPAMDQIATSSLYLKNSLGAMAAPLIQAVAPAIDFLVDKFVSLLNVINMVFAALGGSGTYTKAIKKSAQYGEDLSGSMGGAAASAKEFKKYLIGIDELTIIPDQSDSGRGGGGGYGGSDYASMFEETEIQSKVSGWAGEVRKAIENGDWYGAGATLAEKLNEQINNFNFRKYGEELGKKIQSAIEFGLGFMENFDWTNLGKSVSQFIKGIFENIDPTELGKLLSSGIDAAIEFAYGFIQDFSFDDFGKWLSGVVEGWFNGIDWELAGQTLNDGILGLLETFNTFMAETGWEDIKQKLESFFGKIEWDNIIEGASKLNELIGVYLIATGNVALGSTLEVISAVGDIMAAIKDMFEEGVNWENVKQAAGGMGKLVVAIGILATIATIKGVKTIQKLAPTFKSLKGLKGSGLSDAASGIDEAATATEGVSGAADGLNTEAGKLSPKLSSLAKNLGMGLVIIAEVAAAALLIVGTILVLGIMLKKVGEAWQPVIDNGDTIAIAMGIGVATLVAIGTVTALLGTAGTGLIVNIALGLAVLAELGVATALFIAEIWAIGKGLDEIGKAWQPVLDNGETIAIAIGIGTGILIAIGVVTAALGLATTATGGLLPLAIGLGTAMLLELGVATALFIVEIWAIGKGLDEIGKAWQPVLDNGATIEAAISKGTDFLVAIGAVAALLGGVQVLTFGTIDIAIGLGTAFLILLAEATKAFIKELSDVANEMSNKLAPALARFTTILPSLSTNMKLFKDYMSKFAGYVVDYSKDTAVAGIAATINTIVGWFTTDPFKKLGNDVEKTSDQAKSLNEKLVVAVPELEMAKDMLTKYYMFSKQIVAISNSGSIGTISNGIYLDMKDAGKNLVLGFADGIKSNWDKNIGNFFKNAWKNITKEFEKSPNEFKRIFSDSFKNADSAWQNASITFKGYADKITNAFSQMGTGIQKKFVSAYTSAKNAWSSAPSVFSAIANKIVNSFSTLSNSLPRQFTTAFDLIKTSAYILGQDIAKGISNGAGYVQTAATLMKASLSDAFITIKSNAYDWGVDIAKNIAQGMKDNTYRVGNASRITANEIKSYLHFSEPDVGPLSDFHTYMPDMMKQIAQGIRSNLSLVSGAVSDVADSISRGISGADLNMPEFSLPPDIMDFNVNREMSIKESAHWEYSGMDAMTSQMDENNEDVINTLFAISQQIISAIKENGDKPIYMNGRLVSDETTNTQNRMNRMYGKTLQNT